MYGTDVSFKTLLGKTLVRIDRTGEDILEFEDSDGVVYRMLHHDNCCESVYIESIVGNLEDLIGSPIIMADESTKDVDCEYGDEMWTFYKLATVKGYVDIRWNGSSNGYYSISVDFEKMN